MTRSTASPSAAHKATAAVENPHAHRGTRTGMVGRSPVIIGRFTYGLKNLRVREWNEGAALRIGVFCSLAEHITAFKGGNHRTDWITTFPFSHLYREDLGNETIVGNPCTNGDIVIGDDPAQLLRMRFGAEIIELLLRLQWWNLPLPAIRELAPLLSAAPKAAALREVVARYQTP